MSIVTIHELTKCFGSRTAVDAFSLAVEPGEVFGLLGPNGAGKSTLIKMLTTLLPSSSGRAIVAGYDIARQSMAVQRRIGYVPQSLSVDGTLTGYENMLIVAKLYSVPRRQRLERIKAALHYVGLESVAYRLVNTYSGGMIRRLEIAQATLHHPSVLFLDEPTVGLDPVARKAMWELILQLQQDYNTTVFLTTHFMDEADVLCDRLAILYHGQQVAIGTPATLKTAIQRPDATLDDVFIHYTGDYLATEEDGGYHDTSTTRRTAQRLG
ncbi:ABC transporter ATP-binding protein [Gloeocapsopsis dulcis]|uniref:Multidrug ABC transporter ATP-binding protein n=1 Tax=Gloeocapsopsis dulcis AAB1 = 1H9 TaxID=1433147 RepID=A0A6N8FW23_9CHRO|nr:ATP-binding cassette domain-containing protein [Gloeocapsopsis dulcis]MUL36146.1 multidrug ABC transporter ATP-binding protein [Gloeocapsopsis dulcis AAB1 = 1H9]WNN91377.1 ATP-binding cassette domain-containing protein [Gloeocapsopsis dulcis]